MFNKLFNKKKNSSEVDYASLNQILSIGSKLSEIIYIIAIIAIVILGTHIIKEWGILTVIKELLVVVSPIFIGFLIAWLFNPFVKMLQKKKVPRILGCIISYLLIIGGLILLLYLLIPAFASQIKDFVSATPELLKDFKGMLDKVFLSLGKMANYNGDAIKKEVYKYAENLAVSLTTSLPTALMNIGKSLVSGGITFVLGLMIGFYMLFDFDKLNTYIKTHMPKSWIKSYDELGKRLDSSLRDYLQGLLLIMLVIFITQSIGLTLAGLKAPMIFALFCALTDVIPYFGPYIGAIPATLVGFTISPITGVCVIISIIVVQLLENNFYQPLIMGKTMKLHPVTIMLGLLIFQHFFGIIGMIVATPVIAALKIIVGFINEKLEITKKITNEEAN